MTPKDGTLSRAKVVKSRVGDGGFRFCSRGDITFIGRNSQNGGFSQSCVGGLTSKPSHGTEESHSSSQKCF